MLEEALLEVEVQLCYQLLLLVLLENLGVVLESAESVLDLDCPARIGREVEAFDVGLELAEDLSGITRVEDFIGIEICDLLDQFFSLKVEEINLCFDLLFKFLVI